MIFIKLYNKLVRDQIPEIIKSSGKNCNIEIVDNELCLEYLYEKLNEEVNELLDDKNLDEIADVIEVLFAIANKYGYSEEDVLDNRLKKKIDRGGFEKNIILKSVY